MKSLKSASQNLGGELIRFAVVGVLATVCHVACYLGLYPAVLSQAAVANVIAFSIAVFVSYIGNSRWVFPGGARSHARLIRFGMSALTGLLLNTLIAWVIVDTMHRSEYLSVVLMVTVTPMAVFLLNKYFVFRAG